MKSRAFLPAAMAVLCLVPGLDLTRAHAMAGKVPAGLLNKLGSQDPDERDSAVAEIVKIGKDAVPALSDELGGRTVQSRCSAILCLERIADPKSVKQIEHFLKSAAAMDEILYSVKALGAFGAAAPKALLKTYLAYKAPMRLDEKTAGWIADKSREAEEGLVRNQAAESLAKIGDFSGVPVLIDGLDSNGWVRRDSLIRLRKMTGCKVDFGYNLGESRKQRAEAIEKWKKWWEAGKAKFKPEWTDSHLVFDVNKRGG